VTTGTIERVSTGSASRPGRAARRRALGGGVRRRTIVLAVSPALVLVACFFGVPIVQGIRFSFSSWGGTGPIIWDGLNNYRQTFTASFASTLLLTVRYSVLSMAGIMAVALGLAAAVSAGVRGSTFYRIVWFLPGVAPLAAVGVFWSAAFQPGQGVVNAILGSLGLGNEHAWLAETSTAIYPVIAVTIWASVGFAFLLLLGAMEQIPVSLYEAARIDGAGKVRAFFSITLPLVRPVATVVALLELIWTFNGFTIIWAMTLGGPGTATSILPVLVYRDAFQNLDFGLASSMAVVGGVILMIIGIVSLKVGQSRQQVLL
jgi:raffinose/stachyose/melibiose transport system permease protein